MPRIYCVDVFTSRPFRGNPAGVCVLEERREPEWMQQIAKEINLPETTFILPSGEGYSLQWFTPAAEVDLSGHGTLAAAHVLWDNGYRQPEFPLRFSTRNGIITAKKTQRFIWLDLPALPVKPVPLPPDLGEALSLAPIYTGRNSADYLIEVGTEQVVRDLHPDFSLLCRIPTRGVIVTSRSGAKDYDFISRFFAPSINVPENQATGTAHCALATYWGHKLGKTEMTAYQASKRGGTLMLRLNGDRVLVGGLAVTIWKGDLLV